MAAAALLRGEAEALRHPPILTPTRIRRVPKNHNCRQGTRGDRSCPEGTVNNPEAPGERFGKTASGWRKTPIHATRSGWFPPGQHPRDLDGIPESVGGNEPQPAGHHVHDRLRTGTTVGRATALVDANAKVTGQAWYGDDVRLPNEVIGRILRSPHHYARIRSIDTSAAEAMPVSWRSPPATMRRRPSAYFL